MSGRVSLASRGSERLAGRRRTRYHRAVLASIFLVFAFFAAVVYGLQQSAVRISHIEIFGADASLATYAADAMRGSYLGIVPRDSTFFFPEGSIRASILAADRSIAAVSIFRSGLTGLSIKVDSRTGIARWCFSTGSGEASTSVTQAGCYVFDANGFIFSAATSTTQTINAFTLYAPLVGDTSGPLGASIADAEQLPATFDFARQLATLGSPVSSIVIHDGEVDDYLASDTRITYVLGNEQNAFTALVSAHGNFNLADGSVTYVDLRFNGKVYVKKK